ncbi:MAG: magnesium transporter [Myxococcales bacterium]|nr:magnesium transporter [Myxococcales bacterium]
MNALADRIATHFLTRHPTEAARTLESLPPTEIADVLRPLGASERAEVLRPMGSAVAAAALATLDDELARETLLATDAVRAARWLALLDDAARSRLRGLLPPTEATAIAQALEYPPGTAGALMDAGVSPFPLTSTVEEVLTGLRRIRNRRISDLMVCEDDDRLVGVVPLQELLGAPQEATLQNLVHRETPTAQPMTARDEVVDLLERHRLASLPVVDFDQKLLGVIRYDGLVRAAQQEAAGDLNRMVGAGAEERALSSPWLTVKSRLPWLLINLLTAFAAAAVVGLFDATIARFTALAVLLPVVAGQSGNTGAQALAVTSRGLALREIRAPHFWQVVRKEVMAAAANGVAVALVTAGGVFVWSGNPGLCAVIGISMVVSMVLAACAGAAIPIGLTALGRDPATASSIVLTTVTDIAGFFSFLGLATALAHWLV